MRPRSRKWLIIPVVAGVALVFLLLLQLALTPVYDFPPAAPFAGEVLYNPYEKAAWPLLLCNFHCHSHAWGGLTNGAGAHKEMRDVYASCGYDALAISNYQKISRFDGIGGCYIPVYEHGINALRTHQLSLGARGVTWLDYPLYQGTQQKQHVIDALKGRCDLAVLAHPVWNAAYNIEDMTKLTGYDGLEVFNRYTIKATAALIAIDSREAFNMYAPSLLLWDAALSSGRCVWGLGGDDTHRVDDMVIRCWTMVFADGNKSDDVMDALRRGAFYAVSGKYGNNDNSLLSQRLDGNRLKVECKVPADLIIFIGQGGRELKKVVSAASAEYEIQPADTYVRVMIKSPRTAMALNPVIRTAGAPPRPIARINWGKTWVMRAGFAGFCLGVGYLTWWRKRQKSQ